MINRSKVKKTVNLTCEELHVISMALIARINDIKNSHERKNLFFTGFVEMHSGTIENLMQQEIEFLVSVHTKIIYASKGGNNND